MLKSFLSGIMVVGMLSAYAGMAYADDNKLVILHTNDTHSQIDPDPDHDFGGVARRKVLIDSVKNVHDKVLLIDAGDMVQGTLFFNLYEGEVENKLADALGYDIRILGNHEFDNGMDGLRKQIMDAKSQWLSTNYKFSDSDFAKKFAPYTIKEFDGKKIGFIALNLQPKGMISPGNYDGVEYMDLYDAANSTAWLLKNSEGCDLVVAITHIGYKPNGTDTNDLRLAANSKDIDIILGGHSHTGINPDAVHSRTPWLVPNAEGNLIMVAQNAKAGKSMSEITIDLKKMKYDYKQLTVDKRLDDRLDPKIEEIIAPYRPGVDSLMNLRVAESAVDLPANSTRLLNFLADYMKIRGNELVGDVDFGMVNIGGVRRGLKAGKVTEGQVLMMLPFNNKIEVLNVSGKDLIENFNIMVGGDGLSASVSSDVEVVYDPVSKKCSEVLINGKPIDPTKTYRLATIDYLANGGDYMEPLTRGCKVGASKDKFSTDFLKYLRKNFTKKLINPSDKQRIHTED